jgi:hypothetical protein
MLLQFMVSLMYSGGGTRKRPLFGAFLDIQQAFDSIDHGHLLLILRDVIKLPRPWLEVIRLLLIGNTTSILGTTFPVTCGTLQGSPLSPLLCICFFQDLAVTLKQHLETHPEDWPTLPVPQSLPGLPRHVLLLVLLMFADDITILASSPAALQRLLDVVTSWASHRNLRISAKSFAAPLCGRPSDIPRPVTALLRCGSVSLPWKNETFDYLGVPFQPYSFHHRVDQVTSADASWVPQRLESLAPLLAKGPPSYCPYVPAYLTAIWHLVLNKALYPTQAIRLNLDSVDTMLNKHLRRVLVLPPTYPTGLLRWELRFPPLELIAERMALFNAFRFVHIYSFYQVFIRPAFHGGQWAETRAILLECEPIRFLITLFEKYRSDLVPARHRLDTDPAFEVWRTIDKVSLPDWRIRVQAATFSAFRDWTRQRLHDHPDSIQALTSFTFPGLTRLPGYFMRGKALAHIGLRFKGPRLVNPRTGDPPEIRSCNWCSATASEYGFHFMSCPALPAALQSEVSACYEAIVQEDHSAEPPVCFFRVSWAHQSNESCRQVLRCMAHIIAQYRLSFPDDDSRARVWPIDPSLL